MATNNDLTQVSVNNTMAKIEKDKQRSYTETCKQYNGQDKKDKQRSYTETCKQYNGQDSWPL